MDKIRCEGIPNKKTKKERLEAFWKKYDPASESKLNKAILQSKRANSKLDSD